MQFVDTSILLYSVSTVPDETAKSTVAREVLDTRRLGRLGLSVQVLQEFFVQVTRTGRPDALGHELAAGLVESFQRFAVQPITAQLMTSAIVTHRRFGISYWDAAIIEAAREMRCEVVLSEDLNHGQDYDGVTVINPFR